MGHIEKKEENGHHESERKVKNQKLKWKVKTTLFQSMV